MKGKTPTPHPDPPVAKGGDIPLVKGDKREKEQAAQVHEYLKKRLSHNWRLETWSKKYQARLRVYGLEKCLIAIDGFASQKWWVENKSQDAPECIFRSDKSFERFLAAGLKLPEHDQEVKDYQRKLDERISDQEKIRERLSKLNVNMTERLQRKLKPLRDEINEQAWNAFIKPLLFVSYEKGVVILFHELPEWVTDHYLVQIERALGCRVKVISDFVAS